MLSIINIQELDTINTNKILERLDEWRLAICPDGSLAKQACFVLNQRPYISIHPDQLISTLSQQQEQQQYIITERMWSNNLVEHGVINHLNDDIMMKTLSEFFMIFHSLDKVNNYNTLHSLQLFKHASFKVDNISRPTRKLQVELDKLLALTNLNSKWEQLNNIWNTFGYLWPRKIILGYKSHLKETYKFIDGNDCMNGYYYNLNKLKEKQQQLVQQSPFDLDAFLKNGIIVSRVDTAPIHEFFHADVKNAINEIIQSKFIQIPVYRPIKIYNISTHSYLCWDPYGNSQQDPSFDGENHDYLVRAVSAEPSELAKSPESQYIWRFTWTPTTTSNKHTFDSSEYRSQTVRGCNKVYIYPACKSISPSNSNKKPSSPQQQAWQINDRVTDTVNLIDTHKMVLSCRPYRYEAKSPQQPEFSKLRALRLLSTESPQYKNEKIDWTIEYPDNGLKYMTDAQANIKLNFHEHVRRMKPLLNGDIIQLQQIGLLTAFPPVNKAPNNNSPQQQHNEPQSLRTTKKMSIARKPTTNSKSRFKKNVLCVDEDITVESWRKNTFWRIELATKDDMIRHSSNYMRWKQSSSDEIDGYPKEYHDLLSQDIRNHLPSYLDKETGSLVSTASSLRRTRSLGSLHESINNMSIHTRDDSDKAQYFEDLVNTKSRSKILTQIAKVSLQPLAQLVKPSKAKQHKHLSPPPFKTYPTS